ncbi:putative aminopeptidase [Papiliotrema laurentii]|uniref:Peptide hydrolase n=1 Tax=Papiliotrema laurentii TaxID=5418 RepID=A0AAD9CY15_PAPLA|nr:putative aminopeptidase [Papiliotrema laurentii]
MRAALLALLPMLATTRAAPTVADTEDGRMVLITDTPPSGCLAETYYGTYGGYGEEHIYIPSGDCLDSKVWAASSGSLIPLSGPAAAVGGEQGRLVWVGQAGVEGVDNDIREDWTGIESLSEVALATVPQGMVSSQDGQVVFGDRQVGGGGLSLLHANSKTMLLHVSSTLLPILDTLLPPHLVPVALPLSPLPRALDDTSAPGSMATTNEWKTVPPHYARHLGNITRSLKFDAGLDKVLNELNHDQVRRNVRWLTGEGPSGITSRHSFTPGAIKAAHWLKAQTEATGATCQLEPFLLGFSPNVICTYPSTTNSSEQVILSAHYDSRGSWGSIVAPGGDDDGSGSGHLLAVAQAIGKAGVQFEKKVVLAFFAGEEQGLLGSHAHAEKLYNANETVLYHVQADMLAYHVPGEPLQLGLPESIHLPEATYLLGNLSQLYSPELSIGRTGACCSDHQSFLSYGYPASAVFERNGPIADPKYHNTGDVSAREGYDFDQIVSIAKVTMAALLTVGGWSRA